MPAESRRVPHPLAGPLHINGFTTGRHGEKRMYISYWTKARDFLRWRNKNKNQDEEMQPKKNYETTPSNLQK
jgi:heme-degrading monooxygenase HmoA